MITKKLRIWLIYLTVIPVILMAVSCVDTYAPDGTGIKYKKYENRKYDYLVYYPSNWRIKKFHTVLPPGFRPEHWK